MWFIYHLFMILKTNFNFIDVKAVRFTVIFYLLHKLCYSTYCLFKFCVYFEWYSFLLMFYFIFLQSRACSCHDGVRLIYRTRNSPLDDSEPLTETLINLFLVRDLLFQSNNCCTSVSISELINYWFNIWKISLW